MARYFKVVLKIDDDDGLLEPDQIEEAVEDTLEYLGYDLVGNILEVEELDEN